MRAKYDTELPPFISTVLHPGRPVILVVDYFVDLGWDLPFQPKCLPDKNFRALFKG